MTFCVFQNETIDSDQTDDGEGGSYRNIQNIDKENKRI